MTCIQHPGWKWSQFLQPTRRIAASFNQAPVKLVLIAAAPQVYLPMSYVYGRRGTCKPPPSP